MAVIEDDIVPAIGAQDMVQRLADEIGFQAITCERAHRGLEEGHLAELGKLVEAEEQRMALRAPIAAMAEILHLAARQLIQEEAHKRHQAGRVRGRRLKEERHGLLAAHQVGKAEIGRRCFFGNEWIGEKAEEAFGGGFEARLEPLFTGLEAGRAVQDFLVHFRLARHRVHKVQGRAHLFSGRAQVGELFAHHAEGFAMQRLGIEHVQDDAFHHLARRLVPEIRIPAIAGRIGDDRDDVLDVAHFVDAPAHLEKRIERSRQGGGWRKADDRSERLPEAGRSREPVTRVAVRKFALHIEDQSRSAPGQKRWHDMASALA